jgi:predicted MPP superfamily phosphohydrolase
MIKNKHFIIALIIIFVIILCIAWLILGTKTLTVTEYDLLDSNIPDAFDGYRIVQISDLHNAEFGKDNSRLITKIKEANPDIIVITGDYVDKRRPNADISVDLTRELVKIAPCYYVTGNHEARLGETFSYLEENLKELGVTVLRNNTSYITRNGEKISISGVDDPAFADDSFFGLLSSSIMKQELQDIETGEDYNILLSHHPEHFELYKEKGFNLVFSGHTHGGQFRIPFVGGVFAPDQGIFPKYDAGLFEEDGTSMIISRGIGNSIIPFRINNFPEIVVVNLHK